MPNIYQIYGTPTDMGHALSPLRLPFVDGLFAYVGALVRGRQPTINDLRDPVIDAGHSIVYGKYLFRFVCHLSFSDHNSTHTV